jgi:hypothetical protein
VIGLLVLLIAGATILGAAYATREAQKRAIEALFRQRGAEPRRVTDLSSRMNGVAAVEGRLGGRTVRFGLHTGGKHTPRKTMCGAWLHAPSPLEMELRPATAGELRNLEHGRAIDLVLGDGAFDDSFIVEAAPSEMARALLDRNARTALLTFHPCVVTVAGDKLTFSKSGYLEEPAEIARVLDMCADLASRLEVLPAEILEHRLAGSHEIEPAGYRGASPASMRALEMTPRDMSELAALHQARAKRAALKRALNLAVIALVVLAGVVEATLLAGRR